MDKEATNKIKDEIIKLLKGRSYTEIYNILASVRTHAEENAKL